MHAGFIPWWRDARSSRGQSAGCGGRAEMGWGGEWNAQAYGHSDDGGSFGVRRPLRFLAHRLELEEPQVVELAKNLGEMKTERAQASVDDRRAVATFADAVGGADFDAGKAAEAAKQRSQSAERLNQAVTSALSKIHALLQPEQR